MSAVEVCGVNRESNMLKGIKQETGPSQFFGGRSCLPFSSRKTSVLFDAAFAWAKIATVGYKLWVGSTRRQLRSYCAVPR
jgi:hypothetical protein